MSGDFNPGQKRYLEGFVAGLQIAKAARESAGASIGGGAKTAGPSGPDPPPFRAPERVPPPRGKPSAQEEIKSGVHPLHGSASPTTPPADNRYTKPPGNFPSPL